MEYTWFYLYCYWSSSLLALFFRKQVQLIVSPTTLWTHSIQTANNRISIEKSRKHAYGSQLLMLLFNDGCKVFSKAATNIISGARGQESKTWDALGIIYNVSGETGNYLPSSIYHIYIYTHIYIYCHMTCWVVYEKYHPQHHPKHHYHLIQYNDSINGMD